MAQDRIQLQSFGQNTLRKGAKKTWYFVATKRFDIYYYNNNRQLAQNAGRMAEQALEELYRRLDYTASHRYQIRLYDNPESYQAVVENKDQAPRERHHSNTFDVYFTGDYQSFYRHLRTELAYVLIRDMFYGEGSRRKLQNRAMLFLPEWFYEGLSHYMGEGWQPQDEMMLRSLRGHSFPAMLQSNDPAERRLAQKSVWYFMEERYGIKRLQEIVYMSRLTRSVDGGIISVLGLSVENFTSQWKQFMASISKGEVTRTPPAEGHRELKIGGPLQRIVAAKRSPQARKIAYVAEKAGIFRLKIYDVARRRVRNTGISWNYWTRHSALAGMGSALAWAPDGSQLIVAKPSQNRPSLVYWEAHTGRKERLDLPGDIDRVNSLDWSPDGKKIVLSLATNGQSDLFYTSPRSKNLARLTKDTYDDLTPSWGPQSRRIFFSSNRDTLLAPTSKQTDYRFVANQLDLYAMDYEGKRIRRHTKTPLYNETQPRMLADGRLVFQSDQHGLLNLFQLKAGDYKPPDTTGGQALTDYDTGLDVYHASAEGWIAGNYQDGRRYFYLNDSLPAALKKVPLPAYAASMRKERQSSFLQPDSNILEARQPADTAMPESPAQGQAGPTTEQDSAEQSSETPNIEYYVFDEEEGKQPQEDRNEPAQPYRRMDQGKGDQALEMKPFKINKVAYKSAGKYEPTLHLSSFTLEAGVMPLFGIYGQGAITITDPYQYHRFHGSFRIYQDLQSTDLNLTYELSRFRMNYGAEFRRRVRYYRDFRVLRFRHYQGELFAAYPFDQYQRLRLSGGYHHIQRNELFFTDRFEELDGAAQLGIAELSYIFDNTRRHGNLRYRGLRGKVALQEALDLNRGSTAFSTLRWDMRHYLPLGQVAVLASRFAGAYSTGNRPNRFFIGGENNWLNDDFNNEDDVPLDQRIQQTMFSRVATPLRGHSYNVRNGTKYGLLNLEMRFPLLRLMANKLNTKPLYNFQWLFFYDLGTAWDEGNPFSQRNPVDVERIEEPPLNITVQSLKSPFVQGVGTGLQARILGAMARAELSWGIEDGFVKKPRFSLAFGKNF